MAITERIGFDTASAVANLNSLNTAIIQVNSSIGTLNSTVGRSSGRGVAKSYDSVATSAGKAKTAVNDTATAIKNTSNVGTAATQKLTLSWQTFARVIATQLIIRSINAVGQALSNAAERTAEFETATARISNITDEGAASLGTLRQSVRELAIATGRDLKEVTGASLEALQNDLGTTAQTFKLLEGSADDLAKATGTDLTSSINSISSVLKAYNLDISQSRDISNALFVAYDKGRISLEQLESRLGTVIPQSAALGIKFEESAAAVASLTLSGLNAQTAMTQLRNIQAKLIRPTEELQAAFGRLGVRTGSELIQKFGGLQGALAALRGAFGGNEQEVAKAFGTIRGQLGVLNLLANEGSNYATVLEAIDGRLGAVAAAAKVVNNTTTVKLQKEYQEFLDRLIPVGDRINKLKLEIFTFLNDTLDQFKGFNNSASVKNFLSFGSIFFDNLSGVIDDLVPFFNNLKNLAGETAEFIIGLTDPAAAAEAQRQRLISNGLSVIERDAARAAANIKREFQDPLDSEKLGPQVSGILNSLRDYEQAARLTANKLQSIFSQTTVRISENKAAFEEFRGVLEGQLNSPLLSLNFDAFSVREQLRGISDDLAGIIDRSDTATGTEFIQLQKELELQKKKVESKKNELGLDDQTVRALLGQINNAQQVLENQKEKRTAEQGFKVAVSDANEALKQQQLLAIKAGTSITQLTGGVNKTSDAIRAIPDPQVNTSPAIASMNRLRDAAIEAGQAIATAAGGGQALYHGGRPIHRAGGGPSGRGQDTIPAMLSPGEFVMNKRSTGRFFSQLQAMNAGQSQSYRETGGSVTSIGDINVNVTGGSGSENPGQTGRQIASEIRRELRRKTSRI